jgi:hypothetical protein
MSKLPAFIEKWARSISPVKPPKKHSANKKKHIVEFIPAVFKGGHRRRSHQLSAWKEHKHLNALRHVAHR